MTITNNTIANQIATTTTTKTKNNNNSNNNKTKTKKQQQKDFFYLGVLQTRNMMTMTNNTIALLVSSFSCFAFASLVRRDATPSRRLR
jgi:hypothetical protein